MFCVNIVDTHYLSFIINVEVVSLYGNYGLSDDRTGPVFIGNLEGKLRWSLMVILNCIACGRELWLVHTFVGNEFNQLFEDISKTL